MNHPTRIAGILLVLFALTTILAPFLPSHAPDTPTGDLAAFFRDDAVLQSLQAWLHVAGAGFLLAALAVLYPRLRDAGPRGPAMAITALVAAGGMATLTFVAFMIIMTGIRGSNEGFDPQTGLFIYNTGWSIMAFAPTLLAPFLLVPFGLIVREAQLPGWLRGTSLAMGGITLLAALATAHPVTQGAAFLGIMVLILWGFIAGVTLAVRGHVGTSAPTGAPTER